MTSLKFGWHLPSFPVDGSSPGQFVDQIEHTLDYAQDRFDSAWADDHFVPWASWQSVDTPFLECMTTISHLAGAFPHIKFGSSVLSQSYRNPALLAKMSANLQLLTRGRFILGIGAGWLENEYYAYGYEFPRPAVRIAQLQEAVQIIRMLWTQKNATFTGKYYQITDAYCEPKPDPAPPILIGGGGEQLTLRVVAKYADRWNIPGGTRANYAHKLNVLRDHCAKVGRDFNDIVKSWSLEAVALAETETEAQRIAATSPFNNNTIAGAPQQVADQLRAIAAMGVDYLIFRFIDFPAMTGIKLFCEEVMPLL